MKKQDFYFDLPEALIAQYPLENRSDSRLLSFSRQSADLGHHHFSDLPELLQPGDLLVMNDSKVIPARVYAQKETGGKLELLVERVIDDRQFLAHIKGARALRAGQKIWVEGQDKIQLIERQGELFLCQTDENVFDFLNASGHMPLPPYIHRQDEVMDAERYQTVYARAEGSVAAPTAGLHFDESLLQSLAEKSIHTAYVTLHVGAGTFQPVRTENIHDHKMHSEWYALSEETCRKIADTKAQGGRVIAVGTTALRTLESAASLGALKAHRAETDIFIYPGYQFQCCDGLITNFHLPESTLLMLVSAFIGYDQMRAMYQEAIRHEYRFFSYGDASLLL